MVIADSIGLVLLTVVLLKFPTLMTALIPLAVIVLVASNFVFMRRQAKAPDPRTDPTPKKTNAVSLYAVCLVFSVGIIRGIFMLLRGGYLSTSHSVLYHPHLGCILLFEACYQKQPRLRAQKTKSFMS